MGTLVRSIAAPAMLGALAWSLALACARSPDGPLGATAVIVVSIDTLRPDHLGCYGYRPPTSPNLDAFCRQAVVFEEARAHAPSTLLSHASLFTSLIPQRHGSSHVRRLPIRADRPTLAEVYQQAGWRTAGFYGGGQLAADYGFGRGFEIYAFRQGAFAAVVPDALEWLDGLLPGERFFLFLHTFEVHHPYEPRPETLRRFDAGYRGPLPPAISVGLLSDANEGRLALDDADRRHVVATYDAEIREMDASLGDLLGALDERGLLDRTLLVFTSDHGEEFGEHGFLGWHSHTLYEELLRVPLVIRLPGGSPARVGEPVQLVDVVPTLLQATGVRAPEGLEGLSLAPLLSGGSGSSDLRRRLHRRPHVALAETEILRLESVRLGRYKLIGDALFDLENDPRERFDLAAQEPEVVRQLRHLQALAAGGAPAAGTPVTLSEETEAVLRSLGYLGGRRR